MTTTNMGWTEPTIGSSADVWGNLLNAITDNQDAHMGGLIKGLAITTAGSTATFGVTAGAASGMVLSTNYTKTASAWAVGSGNGALDTGAVANNTWYHFFLIQRTDTGVVDVIVSATATPDSGPTTMPSGYTRYRRLGSRKTDGSAQWIKCSQFGDEVLWTTAINDAAEGTAAGATTALTASLSVPSGVQVYALFTMKVLYTSTAGTFYVSSFDQTDVAPAGTNLTGIFTSTFVATVVPLNIRTNTSGQVRHRYSASDPTYAIYTRGWIDRRGQI